MRAALAGRPRQGFPRPDTRLVQVALDVERACLPNRFTPAAEVASLVYLKAAAPTRTCREPEGPLAGVVPAVVGVPVARAAGWLEAAGLSLAQRLRVDGEVPPGTVLAQSPAGGTARPAGGAGGDAGRRGRGRLRRRPGPGRRRARPGLALRTRQRRSDPGRRAGPALGQPAELPAAGHDHHSPARPGHHDDRRTVGRGAQPGRRAAGRPGRPGER